MTTEEAAEPARVRPRYLRLLPLAMAVGGMAYFGPKLQRHDIKFELGSLACAQDVSLDLFQDGVRIRGVRLPATSAELDYDVPLSAGAYLAKMVVACRQGPSPEPLEQPVIVDREGSVRLEAASGCMCPSQ